MSEQPNRALLREGVNPVDNLAELRKLDALFLCEVDELLASGLRGKFALYGDGARAGQFYDSEEEAWQAGLRIYGPGHFIVPEVIENEKPSDPYPPEDEP